MATKTIIVDKDQHQLECYINADGGVYMHVGDFSEEFMYNGHIVLDKEDVRTLINMLTEYEQDMAD